LIGEANSIQSDSTANALVTDYAFPDLWTIFSVRLEPYSTTNSLWGAGDDLTGSDFSGGGGSGYYAGEEKVSGLFSGELSADRLSGWEDQDVQTKRAGFITP
jgi:hypothetical protein